MHQTLTLRLHATLTVVFLLFLVAGCDRDSAVNTGEYVTSRAELIPTKVTRLTVYFLPDAPKSTLWAEASLKRKGFRSMCFVGASAIDMWLDLSRNCDERRIPEIGESKRISLGVVAETSSGQKYFANLDRMSVGNGDCFLGVDGIGDDNWWMEAKSKTWDDVLK